MYEGYNFRFLAPRLAKRIAALKLATVMSTPNVTPAHPKSAAYNADWASGCESGQGSQSSEDKDEARSGDQTQILSLYAYRYPVKTLQRIHEP